MNAPEHIHAICTDFHARFTPVNIEMGRAAGERGVPLLAFTEGLVTALVSEIARSVVIYEKVSGKPFGDLALDVAYATALAALREQMEREPRHGHA